MARNLKPKVKIARRLKLGVTEKQIRILNRRPTPPGQHGQNGHPRLSEYGKQLQEKQKAKFIYGVMERQFRNYVTKSFNKKGDSGILLFNSLERRLDNVIYRGGLATTRTMARQMVSHGHFTVNGQKVNIPSYQVKIGEVIALREKSKDTPLGKKIAEKVKQFEPVSWLHTDAPKFSIKVTDEPKINDMTGEFDTKLIIEFYSK